MKLRARYISLFPILFLIGCISLDEEDIVRELRNELDISYKVTFSIMIYYTEVGDLPQNPDSLNAFLRRKNYVSQVGEIKAIRRLERVGSRITGAIDCFPPGSKPGQDSTLIEIDILVDELENETSKQEIIRIADLLLKDDQSK